MFHSSKLLRTRKDYINYFMEVNSRSAYFGGKTIAIKMEYLNDDMRKPRIWKKLINPASGNVNDEKRWIVLENGLESLTTEEMRRNIAEGPCKDRLADLKESEYTPYPVDKYKISRERLEQLAALLATGEYLTLVNFHCYTLDLNELHYNQIFGYWYFKATHSANRIENLTDKVTESDIRLYKRVNF